MENKIKNKQKVAFNKLINDEIPKLLNTKRIIGDRYEVQFTPYPINVNEPFTVNGTIYCVVKVNCSVLDKRTKEKMTFNLDLLNLPILLELGFRVHNNDMQVLDAYSRTTGWSFSKKYNESKGETISATLLPVGDSVRSLDIDFTESKGIVVSRKNKDENDIINKIDICTFLKAITGENEVNFIQMFGFDNAYVLNAFNPDRKKINKIKGLSFNNRNDCIILTAHALLGKGVVDRKNVISDLQKDLNRCLFDKNYFYLGEGNLKRLHNTQSFINRAINKYLAEDIVVNGTTYEAGITLTETILQDIDNTLIDTLKVEYNGKIYNLHKFSIFTFRVLGMKCAEELSVGEIIFHPGHVFTYDDLDILNNSNLTQINVLDNNNKSITIVRRIDASKLYLEDLYTALSILFDNINGFNTIDNEYELTNRVVIPFDKKVLSILESHLNIICNKLKKLLSVNNDTDDLLPTYLRDFSLDETKTNNLYDLNKFINYIAGSESLYGQMSDTTNIMSYLEKSNKVTANINHQSVTNKLISVQDLQNGRLDPIDSPESSKIGIVHHRTVLTKEDADGNLLVPFLKVKDGEVVSNKPVYLTAVEEKDKYIAEWNEDFKNPDGTKKTRVLARYCGNVITVDTNMITYKEYSQLSSMSPARACIPFQNHSSGKRLLMSCNHHKQAVPTIGAERARVGTGCESILDVGNYLAKDLLQEYYNNNINFFAILGEHKDDILNSDLKLTSISIEKDVKILTLEILALSGLENNNIPKTISVILPFARKTSEKNMFSYNVNAKPENIYHPNDVIAYNTGYSLGDKEVEVYADYGSFKIDKDQFKNGLALGMNLTVAFKTYESSTIDDAITISSEIVMDDTLTSIFMVDVKHELSNSPNKEEYFQKVNNYGIPEYIKSNGMPKNGTILKPGDIVMAYVSKTKNSSSQKTVKLNSYTEGQVIDSYIYTKNNKRIGKVIIASRATMEEGDKMSGRHGNKGVIAKIKPMEEMPYDPETGRTVQVLLNPLGIPSRMNISQLLELVVGEAMRKKDHIAVFSPFFKDDLKTVKELAEHCDVHPKYLADGRTGKMFKRPVNYGTLYMFKLIHMVNKKAHSIGSNIKVDPVFMQPRRGQKQDGGQSFEEMCSWCVAGIGANKVLQDIYTLSSDDIVTRKRTKKSIMENPLEVHANGVNNSDTIMQACIRSLGCELVTIENGYEFMPLTDEMIKGLSSNPVEHERSLHSPAIFGNNNTPEDSIRNRDKWGWIDLGCEIIHPTWLHKGNLNVLILALKDNSRNLAPISKKSMRDIIKSNLFAYLPDDEDRIEYVFLCSKEEYSKLSEESKASWKTGMSTLVEIFKKIDVMATKREYERQLKKNSSLKQDITEKLRICNSFLNSQDEDSDNSLKEYVISSFPVMPQTFRPVMDGLGINDVPDFDWHYKQIFTAVIDVKNKHQSAESLANLYNTIAVFIGYESVKDLKYQTVLLWFYGHNSTNKNHGKVRDNIQKKRTVCSGRSTIIPMRDVKMKPTQIGVPFTMIVKMYSERLMSYLSTFTKDDFRLEGRQGEEFLNLLASKNKNKFFDLYLDKYQEHFEIYKNIIPWFLDRITEYIEGSEEKNLKSQVVLAGRQPSLHRFSVRAFFIKIVFSKAIEIHPLACKGYNADFDGDTMWLLSLITEEAKDEAIRKMSPEHNFINPKNNSIIIEHSQDIVLGCYCATMLKDNADNLEELYDDTSKFTDNLYHYGDLDQLKIDVQNSIIEAYDFVCYTSPDDRHYLSTAGRILFNALIPDGFTNEKFTNVLNFPINSDNYFELKYDGLLASGEGRGPIKYHSISKICRELFEDYGEKCIDVYQSILEFGFFFSDLFSVTLSIEDLDLETNKKQIIAKADKIKALIEKDYQKGLVSEEDKKDSIIKIYKKANDEIKKDLIDSIPRNNNFFIIYDSGARGNASQLMQTSGALGILQKTATEDLETSITSNYTEGISSFDMHLTTYSARTGVSSTQNETSTAGYATRHAVYSAAGFEITEYDCGKKDWWYEIEWADHIEELDKFIPTKEWFEENLLGKVTADGETFELLKDCLDSVEGNYGLITEDCFAILQKGFSHLSVKEIDEFYDPDDDEIDHSLVKMFNGEALSSKTFTYDVAMEGKGLFTPYNMEIIPEEDNLREFKHLAKLNIFLNGDDYETSYYVNNKCISIIKEKHIKQLKTVSGTFIFRYKMSLLSRSILVDREGRNLPFLKPHTEVFSNGKILRVNLITEKTLDWIESEGLDRVEARLMLDCEAEYGICSRCYGLGFSDAKLQDVGANIGIEAAQSIGEPAAQLTMSLVNSGGVAGESVASGITVVQAMLEGNLPKKGLQAQIAKTSGYVNLIRYDDTVGIRIEPENMNTNKMCIKCIKDSGFMECPYNRVSGVPCLLNKKQKAITLSVTNGQYVKAGDQITSGFLHPDNIDSSHIQNLEELLRRKQIIWLDSYFYTFTNNNIFINPRHFEIFARLQIFKITNLDTNTKYYEGERYDYSKIRKDGCLPTNFEIRTSKIEEVVADNSGLLAALSFEDVSKLLANFTIEKKKVDITHNNSIIGGLNLGADLLHLKTTPKKLSAPTHKYSAENKSFQNGAIIETILRESSDAELNEDIFDNLDLNTLSAFGDVADVDVEGDFGIKFDDQKEFETKSTDSPQLPDDLLDDLGDLGIGEVYNTENETSSGDDKKTVLPSEEYVPQMDAMNLFGKKPGADLTEYFTDSSEIQEISDEKMFDDEDDVEYDVQGIILDDEDDDSDLDQVDDYFDVQGIVTDDEDDNPELDQVDDSDLDVKIKNGNVMSFF